MNDLAPLPTRALPVGERRAGILVPA